MEFVSVDPSVASTDQPYIYTGDDPINATDPSGRVPTVGDVATALFTIDSFTYGVSLNIGFEIDYDYETSVWFTRLLNWVDTYSTSTGAAINLNDNLLKVACGELSIRQGLNGASTDTALFIGLDCYGTLNVLVDSSSGRQLVKRAADSFSCIDVISGFPFGSAQPSLDKGDPECNARDAYSRNGLP